MPVINGLEQWHQWTWAAKALDRSLPAVLQFDTSRSRFGPRPKDRSVIADLVSVESGINVLFVMSHLASADDAASGQNESLEDVARDAGTISYEILTGLGHRGDISRTSFWSGLRPMTPDGTPVIRPTRIEGLFLTTGHGTLG